MRVPLGAVRLACRLTVLPFKSTASAAAGAPQPPPPPTPICRPFVPRVAPCKQTCAGPGAHKHVLKSNGGNVYQCKYQTHWLDIISLPNTHTHSQMCLRYTALKIQKNFSDPRILWIICSRSYYFFKQPPHTEKPCSKFIVAGLKMDPPLLEGRDGESGRTMADCSPSSY